MAKPLPAYRSGPPGDLGPGAWHPPAPSEGDPAERRIVHLFRVLTLHRDGAPACFFRKKTKTKKKQNQEETLPAALHRLALSDPACCPENTLPSQPGRLQRSPVAESAKATVPEGPEATPPHLEAGPPLSSGGGLARHQVHPQLWPPHLFPATRRDSQDQVPGKKVTIQTWHGGRGSPQLPPPGLGDLAVPSQHTGARGEDPLGDTPSKQNVQLWEERPSDLGSLGTRAGVWVRGWAASGLHDVLGHVCASGRPSSRWLCMFPLVISSRDSCS